MADIDLDKIQISEYDKNQLRDLEIDSVDSVQEGGRSFNRVTGNFDRAFRLGFTAVGRGEGEGQEHPPLPDFMLPEDMTPAPVYTNAKVWAELQSRANLQAAFEYYERFPNDLPEGWSEENCRVLLGPHNVLVVVAEEAARPPHNSYVWAFYHGVGWRIMYYRASDEFPWKNLNPGDAGHDLDDRSIDVFIQLTQPKHPNFKAIAKDVVRRAVDAETETLILQVQEIFREACDQYMTGSQDWEVYAGADKDASRVIGTHENRYQAWFYALKWARSKTGRRYAQKLKAA